LVFTKKVPYDFVKTSGLLSRCESEKDKVGKELG
jgi:hypothetical protein